MLKRAQEYAVEDHPLPEKKKNSEEHMSTSLVSFLETTFRFRLHLTQSYCGEPN